MSLAARLDPVFYTDLAGDKGDIRLRMRDAYYRGTSVMQNYWSEADIDARFVAGDQTLLNRVLGGVPFPASRQFTFNLTQRIINMIGGHQRRNRKTTIVEPIESSDQDTADQFSAILQWAMQKCDGYNILSDAFQYGGMVTGLNLLSLWMDYREDPVSGDIRMDNLAYNSFLIDPFFRKKDLSDCNFIWTRKWLSKDQAVMLLPEREKEIRTISTGGIRDEKFYFMPENYNYIQRNLLPYDEFWYLDEKKQKVLVDMETGETLEWRGDDEQLEIFQSRYRNVRVTETLKPTCRLAIVVADNVMWDGPNPMGIDRFPFAAVFGNFYPDVPVYSLRIQGLVRSLRDPQFLYNRRKILELDLLESSLNSGLKIKEDALVDPNDAFLTGQGRALFLKKTAQMDDVQPIPPPQVPPSMMQLSQELMGLIQQISGVNEELLGSAEDDKAGILEMVRQGAALTTLQVYFDNLDYTQKQVGQIMMDLAQENFTPGKVERITGKLASPQFYNRAFQKYDCVVAEGSLTTTQKQMQFKQLLYLRETGIPVPIPLLLEASTLQNKKELTDAIQAEMSQQAQMMQAQQMGEIQAQQVTTEAVRAKAFSDMSLGQERLAKIELDKALNMERVNRAQEDKSAAILNLIKAAKELEHMDLDALEKQLNIVKAIAGEEEPQQKPSAKRSSSSGTSSPSRGPDRQSGQPS